MALSVFFKISGRLLPAWVHVPAASVPSAFSLPSYLPSSTFISKDRVVLSRVIVSTFSPLTPWSGLSILAVSLPSAVLPTCTTMRRLSPAPTLSFPSQTCPGAAASVSGFVVGFVFASSARPASQGNADHHRRGHEPGFAQTVHHRSPLVPRGPLPITID